MPRKILAYEEQSQVTLKAARQEVKALLEDLEGPLEDRGCVDIAGGHALQIRLSRVQEHLLALMGHAIDRNAREKGKALATAAVAAEIIDGAKNGKKV